MKAPKTTRKIVKKLTAAIAVTCATFGIAQASVLTQAPVTDAHTRYQIIYRTPGGNLTITEYFVNPKEALYAFEASIFNSILHNH